MKESKDVYMSGDQYGVWWLWGDIVAEEHDE